MPIDPFVREHLLESQVREVDDFIAGANLGMHEWGRCSAEFVGFENTAMPCVHFPEKDCFFAFAHLPTEILESAMARSRYGKNSGEHWVQFGPGEEKRTETHREMRWDEVMFQLDRWLSFVARESHASYTPRRVEPPRDSRKTLAAKPLPPRTAPGTSRVSREPESAEPPSIAAKPLELPQKVTLRWVVDHAPLSLWLQLGAALIFAFSLGIAIGTTDIVLQIRGKDTPRLQQETARLRADSAAAADAIRTLSQQLRMRSQ